jgi:beta-glucosidase
MAHRTYRYFDGPVLYPFGFGLSYSSFTYSKPHLDSSKAHAGNTVTATVTLTNTSNRPGDEIAQLYIVPPQQPGMPRLTLQGIQRIHLAPQQSRTLTFIVTPIQLSFVDPAGQRAIRPGVYRFFIGGTQPNPTQTSATLTSTENNP